MEMTILKNILCDEQFARKVIPFLKSEYFLDRKDKILFESINSFISKFNNLPTTEALLIELDDKNDISEEEFSSIGETLFSFKKDDYEKPDDAWLLEQTEKFCQEKSIYLAIMNSIEILNGKSEETKEAIPSKLSDALAISFDTNIGHDYFEDSDERFKSYNRTENHFPFDLEYFNKITNGGLVNKTLNVLIGGPGSGKTLALCHFAASYMTQGKNVLYITLEMAEEKISERIDANLLNVSINDLKDLPQSIYEKKVQSIKDKTTGKLIVKEFPTAQAGVGHFRHLLNELKLKKNFSPDILIIDYINICISSRFKMGSNINSYTYIKSIAEEFRGLAVEKEMPVLTATQLNREGFASSDVGMENTAESFGLPATADLFLAIITNEKLEGLNQLMVKQLKNRYNDPTVNRRFVVGVDRTKMRLYDCDQAAQDNIVDDSPAMDSSEFGKKLKAERKDFSALVI